MQRRRSGNWKRVTRKDVKRMHTLIEHCLVQNLNKEEAIELISQLKIDPDFAKLVWQKLEEENQEFFKSYYESLSWMRETLPLINKFVEEQKQIMGATSSASLPTYDGFHNSAQANSNVGLASILSFPTFDGLHNTAVLSHPNSIFEGPHKHSVLSQPSSNYDELHNPAALSHPNSNVGSSAIASLPSTFDGLPSHSVLSSQPNFNFDGSYSHRFLSQPNSNFDGSHNHAVLSQPSYIDGSHNHVDLSQSSSNVGLTAFSSLPSFDGSSQPNHNYGGQAILPKPNSNVGLSTFASFPTFGGLHNPAVLSELNFEYDGSHNLENLSQPNSNVGLDAIGSLLNFHGSYNPAVLSQPNSNVTHIPPIAYYTAEQIQVGVMLENMQNLSYSNSYEVFNNDGPSLQTIVHGGAVDVSTLGNGNWINGPSNMLSNQSADMGLIQGINGGMIE